MNVLQSNNSLYFTILSLSIFLFPSTLDANSLIFNSTFIGKVFHDKNGDGIQNNNENGIPSVRLSTVSGLTVETDGYGRFHIVRKRSKENKGSIGRNILLKIDHASLPIGAILTTENPRVINTSTFMLDKINFGISY